MDKNNRQAGEIVTITPEMLEAGKLILTYEFGGESENPCADYDETVKALFMAMISASSGHHS